MISAVKMLENMSLAAALEHAFIPVYLWNNQNTVALFF